MGERTLRPLKARRWVNRVSGRNSAGGRGLGLDPKSRMRREAPVRFCEGLGVKLPRATRLVVLARSRRQLERVVLPRLREFLAARGLRLSEEKTKIVRDTEGFDFVGRHFKRLSATKFLVRPLRSSIRKHLDALSGLFRNRALPVAVQIQKANAIIRGFCLSTTFGGRASCSATCWNGGSTAAPSPACRCRICLKWRSTTSQRSTPVVTMT